jgi:ribosome-binding factor A
MTPDLLVARVYLSLFKINQPEKFLESLQNKMHEMRGEMGKEIRHQVRHVPELDFRLDDTLDHVFKLEEIFKKIKK